MATRRIDVVSDTHGRLSEELLAALRGADLIVHAGDFCSERDYDTLCSIAPMYACLGNNDYVYSYPPRVKDLVRFNVDGLVWQIGHRRERLDLNAADVTVCGHTHRPRIEELPGGRLCINPGSPTFPRTAEGPTMARVIVHDGKVVFSEIVHLGRKR